MTLEEQIQKLTAEASDQREIASKYEDRFFQAKALLEQTTAERDAAQADLKAIGECVGGDPLAVRGLVESMDAVIKERDAALKALDGRLGEIENAITVACEQYRLAEDELPEWCDTEDYSLSIAVRLVSGLLDEWRSTFPDKDAQQVLELWKKDVAEREALIAQRTSERDAAQKACAEMRDALLGIVGDYMDEPMHPDSGHAAGEFCWRDVERARHALSSDCGRGYHHNDEWKPVVGALEACDVYLAGASQPTNRAIIKQALAHAEKLTAKEEK